MVLGLALEIVGYVGRIWIHSSPFTQNPFLINIIGLTIGPAFLAAAIYLCLSRIIVVYGESFSRFKPRTYSVSFMIADFVALVLQGAGGGIASTANDQATSDMGVDIMIAGLAWQVVSITLFGIVCADFAWRVRSGRGQKNPLFTSLRESTKWTLFLLGTFLSTLFPPTLRKTPKLNIPFFAAIGLATTTIYIRSIYRVAELSFGFHSSFANQEAQFMILEGGMIGIAVLCLTVFHPGLVFRRQWRAANFSIGGKAKGIKETGWESGSDRSAAEVEMGRVYDPRRG